MYTRKGFFIFTHDPYEWPLNPYFISYGFGISNNIVPIAYMTSDGVSQLPVKKRNCVISVKYFQYLNIWYNN